MIQFSRQDAKGAKRRESLPLLSLRALRSSREMPLVSSSSKTVFGISPHPRPVSLSRKLSIKCDVGREQTSV